MARLVPAIAARVAPAALAIALLGAALGACTRGQPGTAERPLVVATVGMLADMAREVGGDAVEVAALMGPGVDPHLYKVTEGDVALLARADVILYVGHNLEGKMGQVLGRMAKRRRTVAVAETLDPALLRSAEGHAGTYDPHVWFDVALWRRIVPTVREALAEAAPAAAAAIAERAAAYGARLDELDGWVRARMGTIPAGRRLLVTSHDAFGYFGRAYGVEVRGLQGLSTVTRAGLHDIQDLVGTLVRRDVGAVFVETSVNDKGLRAVVEGARARGHAVQVGGTLFSDSMGAAGTPEGTYIGMVRHNVETIVSALGSAL